MIRWTIALISAAVLGLAAGALSFYALTGPFGEEARYGPWTTLAAVGQAKQSPYARARVAIYGIWGLPPSEAIYFSATADSAGHKLDHRCAYSVQGGSMPARWWSLTAYRDGFFIENPTNRYSWSQTDAQIGSDGRWTIRLNPGGSGVNGLALGQKDGALLLSMRLYQPQPGIADHRDRIALPSIVRTSC